MGKWSKRWSEEENAGERAKRLKDEGRWDLFKAESNRLKALGTNEEDRCRLLYPRFGPGSFGVDISEDEFIVGVDKLPSGVPFEDPKYWEERGNPKTTLVQDVEWVESVLLLRGITRDDAPSVTAWGHYQRSIRTKHGEERHHDMVRDIFVPNKRDLQKQAAIEGDGTLDKLFADALRQVMKEGSE